MLVLGVVDFFRDIHHGLVENAVVNLLNRVLLVLILVSCYDPAEAGSGG